ncbi:hypothetical protein HUN41_00215 [Streptomyces phage Coruscant]|uniref:Uncharacterized protein n=1 Tax=Streptomyces phage Coruscant TaxID=2739834 RepID=A0A7G4AWB8_9CAUD|nr:hypothetical protein PP454_gp109 [Streptomyces phage Coruscant]QMP84308.1 hypothetical protein HUN41_00215 [Streptomyces phage Coruscant]
MENIFRANAQDAVAKGICNTMIGCGKPLDHAPFTDETSARESQISGLCQPCQDSVYGLFEDE